MPRPDDASLATLLLTSRLVEAAPDIVPLRASEYWSLVGRADVAALLGQDAAELTAEFGPTLGPRIAALLDRAGALAFAIEQLEQSGVRAIAATDADFPSRWRDRLGAAAPPHVHVAGAAGLLARPSVGIVGSRDLDAAAVDVAQAAACAAVEHDRTVVSGGARGTDAVAMTATLDASGTVVGVLADALDRAVRDSQVRRAVLDGRLCLVTPYAPSAPFSAGNAMGRNKLIYALADLTFVVASDLERGGTWSGAHDALAKGYGTVAVWRGAGEGPGNGALCDLGATPVTDLATLFAAPPPSPRPQPEQLGLSL